MEDLTDVTSLCGRGESNANPQGRNHKVSNNIYMWSTSQQPGTT